VYDGNVTYVVEPDETLSPPLIFGGDVNQDGMIEAEDLNRIGIRADAFDYGYLAEDIFADGVIEASDLNITGNNADEFVYAHYPM
jgi:hypothetical protein